jgi:hypothetical protein
MGVPDLINHVFNFALPAVVVGLMLPSLTRFSALGRQARPGFWWQGLANVVAGLLVLAGGLWFWGHDGKLATYLAMVVACATSQWLMLGAWRR